MYIQRNLTNQINEELYKKYKTIYPYLKNHLPYKTPTIKQTEDIINIIKGESVEPMLQDMLSILNGSEDFKSVYAINLQNKKYIMESKVKHALNNSEGITQNVAFLLGMYDKEACIVGGCVRDSLLGVVPHDWDFVSSKSYEELAEQFTRAGFTINETGKQFLVLNISKNGETFEIARYRKDGMYTDGRHPDSVEVGTIKEDSERRDFTVNALYFNISSDKLIDPTGQGLNDMSDNILRFVGSPEKRLDEDSLRSFRFYRFIAKGFTPETKSLKAVRNLFEKCVKTTTPERMRVELEKIVGVK